MGRRREINRQEADVLANLGHKIHYYYDPAEPVGRHAPKPRNGAVRTKGHRQPAKISLTSQKMSKNIRSTRKEAARVYDAARKVLLAQKDEPLSRGILCEMVATELNKTEKSVQILVSRLIEFNYLKAVFPTK